MKLDDDVVAVLDQSTCEGNKLFLPPGQLERAMYLKVNKAIEALGGKWTKKEKSHVFDEDIADAISDAIVTGAVESRKQALQFFETPAVIARRLVQMAQIKPGHEVLEPSAGRGAIVRAVIEAKPKSVGMVEIDQKNFRQLSIDFQDARAWHIDFLQFDPSLHGLPAFDRIVANPPFSRQQDIDHVLHMWKCLKSGGVLVSVMSSSPMWRENRKSVEFREFVDRHGGSFEALPDNSFRESGTGAKTCVVKIPK